VISCATGVAKGALTYLTSHSSPQALLTAGTAASSSFDLLCRFLGTRPVRPAGDRHSAENVNHDQDGAGQTAL
jgi:hypothetical protein